MADIKQLKKRYDALKSARGVWENHWQEIAEYTIPRLAEITGQQSPGNKRMSKIYDSTGIHALELLAAGLHGLATNPASRWFGLRMTDPALNEDDGVKQYLSDVEQIMRAHMYAPGSGLTTALHESYLELGAFGTSCIFIGQRNDGGLLFQARPLKEVVLAENSDGEVDTIYRCSKLTVRQIEQLWPGKCSDKVRKFLKEKPDELIDVVHCVSPRADRDYAKKDKANMAWMSCYFEKDTDHELEDSGFPEFPYACPRWQKLPGEAYGRSPGMTALPDVKMLQEMMKTTIKAAQKMTDPPLMVPNDGLIGPVRTVPGGLNFLNGEFEIKPLMIDGKLPITLEMMEELRNRIRTTFYTDMLQIVSDKEMTATEVVQRTQERMRLMGPVIGRLESEKLGPMITRVFGILDRQGVLPRPPSTLTGANNQYTIEFVSPIAMAQKTTELNVLSQTLAYLLPLAELKPTVLDRLRTDDLVEWIWDVHGGDPDMIIGDEEWAEQQEEAAAQQEAAALAMGAQPVAKAASDAAGAVDKMASAQQKGADVQGLMDQVAGSA